MSGEVREIILFINPQSLVKMENEVNGACFYRLGDEAQRRTEERSDKEEAIKEPYRKGIREEITGLRAEIQKAQKTSNEKLKKQKEEELAAKTKELETAGNEDPGLEGLNFANGIDNERIHRLRLALSVLDPSKGDFLGNEVVTRDKVREKGGSSHTAFAPMSGIGAVPIVGAFTGALHRAAA